MSLILLRFGAACAASLVLALLLFVLLRRAAARWPALAAHRSVWLMAQAAVALALLLACMPLPRSSVAPVLDLPLSHAEAGPALAVLAPLPAAAPAATASDASASDAAATTAPAVRPDPAALALRWLPSTWLGVYLAGLGWRSARRLRAWRHWRALLRHARPVGIDELRAWPALSPRQLDAIGAGRLTVRSTALPLPPLLFGLFRPCLLLPTHLSTLDPGQQRLVVEHELTHWRRADPLWLALSGLAGLLFWFNRPFQQLGHGLRDAVELGCDDAVLAGRDARERHSYAAALVAQLRLQARGDGRACPAPAFGDSGVLERVQRMRQARPPRLSVARRLLAGALVLALALGGAALQPAFSPAVAAPPNAAHAPAVVQPWRYPLEQVRVTTLYGVRNRLVPTGNHGVDFAARRGTPVLAVADGEVLEAAFDPRWGHYVRVGHGGGARSLVIHLDAIAVRQGQRVAAGARLGSAGDSGRASGPHLHLEYWRDGRRLDPALMLADLDDHATPRALARRRAQGHPIPTDL